MSHRIIIATFGLLTLAMCTSQQKKVEDSGVKETATVQTGSTVTSEENNSQEIKQEPKEPKMSDGFPKEPKPGSQAEAMNKDDAGTVVLKEGENIFLKGEEMNVTFKRMIEDSRCPEGVNCVWEGVATAEIELMGIATRPRTYQISTSNVQNKGLSKTVNFNGYEVSLQSIAPYPTESKNFKTMQGTYKIGLKFKKVSSVDPTTARGGTTTK